MIEALRLSIKQLIFQEVRLLRMEQVHCPSFIVQEMTQFIREGKGRVVTLVQSLEPEKRKELIRRIIDESVDEEIDLTIETRGNKCLRCIHTAYFDDTGKGFRRLPRKSGPIQSLRCEKIPPARGIRCQHFKERWRVQSLGDYLSEVNFLYEVKEMFDRFDEIWEEYLAR